MDYILRCLERMQKCLTKCTSWNVQFGMAKHCCFTVWTHLMWNSWKKRHRIWVTWISTLQKRKENGRYNIINICWLLTYSIDIRIHEHTSTGSAVCNFNALLKTLSKVFGLVYSLSWPEQIFQEIKEPTLIYNFYTSHPIMRSSRQSSLYFIFFFALFHFECVWYFS